MIGALLGEGSSDRALLPIIRWVLERTAADEFRIEWIDTGLFTSGPTLAEKVGGALKAQPCDLLFVHRDADGQPIDWRYNEIKDAVGTHPHVAVVPIRMTEAWLLLDEAAIRAVVGRVSGTEDLCLPPVFRLEQVSDPKRVLREALIKAHDARGRRARRFRPGAALHRLANLVADWSPLRQLSAFQRLEADTRAALAVLDLPQRSEETCPDTLQDQRPRGPLFSSEGHVRQGPGQEHAGDPAAAVDADDVESGSLTSNSRPRGGR